MKSLFCSLAFLCVGVSGFAQTVLTVKGTADTAAPYATSFGYAEGEAVAFTFTLNPAFTANSSSNFTGSSNQWIEELVSENTLFTQVTGDRLTGLYQRPVIFPEEPYSTLITGSNSPQSLEFRASSEGTPIGLYTPSGDSLYKILVRLDGVTNFTHSGSYTSPATYFSGLQGIYPGATGWIEIAQADAPWGTLTFNITEFSVAVIPEPSTYALMLGLLSLGWLIRRRLNPTT